MDGDCSSAIPPAGRRPIAFIPPLAAFITLRPNHRAAMTTMRFIAHPTLFSMRPALLLSVLLAPVFATAAADPTTDTTTPSTAATAPAPASTDGVARIEITGASARDQRRQDTAGRIIVARDELTRYGDTSVAEVLRRQPGVSVVDGAVQLRGMGNGRTQILLNGDPAPPGFSPDSLAPALIERIEILRSASADASTQGIAGSINIVLRKTPTRAGPMSAQSTLAASHGAAGWWPEAALDITRPGETLSATLAMQASRVLTAYDGSVTVRSGAGAITGANNGANTGEPASERITAENGSSARGRLGLAPRLNWKRADGATLAWQSLFDLTRGDSQGLARESVLYGESSTYPHSHFGFTDRTLSARSDASGSQRLGEGGRFEWKAGVAHNRRDSDYLFSGTDLRDTPLWQRHVLSNAVDDSVSTSGKWKVNAPSNYLQGHALALGWDGTLSERSEWRHQEDASGSGSGAVLGAFGQTLDPTLDQNYVARVRRLALYAQDEWSPRPELDVYAGLRWEGLRTRTDGDTNGLDMRAVGNSSGVWSPVAHLLWRMPGGDSDGGSEGGSGSGDKGKRDQLRMALARTYKAPATRDLVPRRFTVNNDSGPSNPHFQGNPALRPELAWGLDVGYESYFGRDGMASVSAYSRRIADVILQTLFQDNGAWVSTPRNSGKAVASGLEFDLRASLDALGWPAATARATLSRNWSRVASVPGPDNRLGDQTPLVLNAGFDYRLRDGATWGMNWNVQAGATTRSSTTQWSERLTVHKLDVHSRWPLGQAFGKPVALRVTATNILAPETRTARWYDDAALGGSESAWRGSADRGVRVIRVALDARIAP